MSIIDNKYDELDLKNGLDEKWCDWFGDGFNSGIVNAEFSDVSQGVDSDLVHYSFVQNYEDGNFVTVGHPFGQVADLETLGHDHLVDGDVEKTGVVERLGVVDDTALLDWRLKVVQNEFKARVGDNGAHAFLSEDVGQVSVFLGALDQHYDRSFEQVTNCEST